MQDKLRAEWKEAVKHAEDAATKLAAVEERQARDPALAQMADLETWAAEWRTRVHGATWHEKRQNLHRLGVRVFLYPHESRESLMAQIEHRALRPGEYPRMFYVVLGWPYGVKQAEPWAPVPLLPEGEPRWNFDVLEDGSRGGDADGLDFTYWLVPEEQYGKLMHLGDRGHAAIAEITRRYKAYVGSQLGEELAGTADEAQGAETAESAEGDEGEQASTASSSSP